MCTVLKYCTLARFTVPEAQARNYLLVLRQSARSHECICKLYATACADRGCCGVVRAVMLLFGSPRQFWRPRGGVLDSSAQPRRVQRASAGGERQPAETRRETWAQDEAEGGGRKGSCWCGHI